LSAKDELESWFNAWGDTIDEDELRDIIDNYVEEMMEMRCDDCERMDQDNPPDWMFDEP